MMAIEHEIWFAWRPVRTSVLYTSPPEVDPIVRAFRDGWHSDKWVWWCYVERIKNFRGDVFYREIQPE